MEVRGVEPPTIWCQPIANVQRERRILHYVRNLVVIWYQAVVSRTAADWLWAQPHIMPPTSWDRCKTFDKSWSVSMWRYVGDSLFGEQWCQSTMPVAGFVASVIAGFLDCSDTDEGVAQTSEWSRLAIGSPGTNV